MKKFEFAENRDLEGVGWAALFGAMSCTVEEFGFQSGWLDAAKAADIAKGLPRLTVAKKFDFENTTMAFKQRARRHS